MHKLKKSRNYLLTEIPPRPRTRNASTFYNNMKTYVVQKETISHSVIYYHCDTHLVFVNSWTAVLTCGVAGRPCATLHTDIYAGRVAVPWSTSMCPQKTLVCDVPQVSSPVVDSSTVSLHSPNSCGMHIEAVFHYDSGLKGDLNPIPHIIKFCNHNEILLIPSTAVLPGSATIHWDLVAWIRVIYNTFLGVPGTCLESLVKLELTWKSTRL